MKKLFTITILSTAVLSACSMNPPKSMMDVQAGEKFILKKPLTVKPDSGRAFIQFGKQIQKSALDHYDQHCSVEVEHLSDKALTIQPEIFTISKVRIDIMEVVQKEINYPLLAANDYAIQSDAVPSSTIYLAGGGSGRDITPTYDAVHFMLSSPSGQNVYRLSCAGSLSNGDPMDAPRSYRPQRDQANKILGSIGEIKQ